MNNKFKRSVQDHRAGKRRFDSRRTISTLPSEENIDIVESNGQTFQRVLPTDEQFISDQTQLRHFPQYRLVRNANDDGDNGDTCADSNIIGCDLNEDVTEFIQLLNEAGIRYFNLTDPTNFNTLINARNITNVHDQFGQINSHPKDVETISANLYLVLDRMREFLRNFGSKISPSGSNPYRNNMCDGQYNASNGSVGHTDSNTSSTNNNTINTGVHFNGPPYNPNDMYTFLDCLDSLIEDTTQHDASTDINVQAFQTILENVKVTKFDDTSIDTYNVARDNPNYSVMKLMVTLIKVDVKFMNILYTLNLHNAFKSPLTGIYYGKDRIMFNDNGVPVRRDDVNNTDLYNATNQLKDLLQCIIELISFIGSDDLNEIMLDHFAIDTQYPIVTAPEDIEITVDASASTLTTPDTDNVPCFVFGEILKYCDATRETINHIAFPSANTDASVTFNDLYEPSKVATIAVNSVYGMRAIMQLIETFMKSDAYMNVLTMLFPSGELHEGVRTFDPLYESDRDNVIDFQSLMHLSIYADVNIDAITPPKSIPFYLGSSADPITINKVLFADVYNMQATISNFFWCSDAPFLTNLTFEDQALFDPYTEFMYPTTTESPTTTSAPTTSVPTTTTSGTTTSTTSTTVEPTTTDVQDQFTMQQGIEVLLAHKQKCVYVFNSDQKIICPLEKYIEGYARYIIQHYNTIAAIYETPRECIPTNRNIYDQIARVINLQ